MWTSTDKTKSKKINKDDLKFYLNFYHDSTWKAINIYSIQQNIFIGILIAVIVSGFTIIKTDLAILSFLIPICIEYIRLFMIETLDRYYKRFLEAVVVTSKIELLLGMNLKVYKKDKIKTIFPEDSYLEIDRRWKMREDIEQYPNSKIWISKLIKEGHNGVTWRFLNAFLVFSFTIPLINLLIDIVSKDRIVLLFNIYKWHLDSICFLISIFIVVVLIKRHNKKIFEQRRKV